MKSEKIKMNIRLDGFTINTKAPIFTDHIPKIGEKIYYKTFGKNPDPGMPKPTETLYRVLDVIYEIEEDWNKSHTTIVDVHVELID